MNRYRITMLGLLALTVALVFVIQHNWHLRMAQSRQHYIEASQSATLRDAARIEFAFQSIYENMRTLSMLSGVRGVEHHGASIGEEGRQTFLQIFYSLTNTVDVSDIYVVPIDLLTSQVDSVTQAAKEPGVMFDHFVTSTIDAKSIHSAGASFGAPVRGNRTVTVSSAPVGSSEIQLLVDQASWFKTHYGDTATIQGLNIPMISGPEITSQGSDHITTANSDSAPSSLVFSVPFYDIDGKIEGMVSAVVPSSALRQLMPSENIVLVNPGYSYVNASPGVKALEGSAKYIARGDVDPDLIYSRVVPLPVMDARSPWFIWSGLPNSDFYNSKETLVSNSVRLTGLMILAISVLIVAFCITLLSRNTAQAQAAAASMCQARDAARKSEAEAQASAEALKTLNEDVSRLNRELADRLKQLTEAQEDIVRKGRMAQLGNLVATVAHELRNPLAGVRTTVFLLQRKLKNSSIDVSSQLQRIEQGVVRCDMIITQLLDFSRTQPANTSEIDMVAWLQNVLQDEAAKLPANVTLKYHVSEPQLVVAIDPERMRRGVVNLVANASEAMTSGDGPTKMKGEPIVTVCLREANGRVELTISDNGPGIAPEILAKIGEPLFTTKSFGTGLGLAAVRKVAELHGGGLTMKSTLGAGAEFTLWFPWIRAQQAAS